MNEVLEQLLGPGEREIGCDECFDELDRYVEARACRRGAGPARPRDGGAPARLPGLQGGIREFARPPRRRTDRDRQDARMTIDTKYLIVGGGMTGDAAAKGIREHDADGSITLVGAEPHPAVRAPAALEEALDGRRRGDDLARDRRDRRRPAARTDDRLGRPATRVATDDQGDEYRYEQLLLATGGRPRRLPGARRRGRLLPHARRLPAAPRAGRARARASS